MADDIPSLMNALIKSDAPLKRGRRDFAAAMQKMGFTSVFDIVRLPKSASARQLARYSDANADAKSHWSLTFPNPTAQLAMLQSVPDIIVHISYTARCKGGSL